MAMSGVYWDMAYMTGCMASGAYCVCMASLFGYVLLCVWRIIHHPRQVQRKFYLLAPSARCPTPSRRQAIFIK